MAAPEPETDKGYSYHCFSDDRILRAAGEAHSLFLLKHNFEVLRKKELSDLARLQ